MRRLVHGDGDDPRHLDGTAGRRRRRLHPRVRRTPAGADQAVPSSAPSADVAGPRVAPARTCGRRTQRTVARAFPDALDLFVVTVQAGYPPLEAIASLRPLVHASIGDVFQVVLERVARGERFGDALASITDALGPRGSAFVDTLAMTERSGFPSRPRSTASLTTPVTTATSSRTRTRVSSRSGCRSPSCSAPSRRSCSSRSSRCSSEHSPRSTGAHHDADPRPPPPPARVRRVCTAQGRPADRRDSGQATTEYALVMLGAAVIALLVITWATAGGGAGKIGGLFDRVIDAVIGKI
jgi:hypothetical protein